ncbi:MAG: hypothetical protein ACOH2I_11540 [Pseudomonas sp.]
MNIEETQAQPTQAPPTQVQTEEAPLTQAQLTATIVATAEAWEATQKLIQIASGVWVHECMVTATTPLYEPPVKRQAGRPRIHPIKAH